MDGKGKRRYVPPVADGNTFATQEDFLDSLQTPISVDSIAENNRKCHHCWRYYGEPNPDQDDAEEPVRFRCGHTFGQSCMKELYRLPQSIKTEFKPIEFGPNSMGLKLIEGIERCLVSSAKEVGLKTGDSQQSHAAPAVTSPSSTTEACGSSDAGSGASEESLGKACSFPEDLSSVNVFEAIVKDLEKLQARNKGNFGPEWRPILLVMLNPTHTVMRVRFFENSVVYDLHESEQPAWNSILYASVSNNTASDIPNNASNTENSTIPWEGTRTDLIELLQEFATTQGDKVNCGPVQISPNNPAVLQLSVHMTPTAVLAMTNPSSKDDQSDTDSFSSSDQTGPTCDLENLSNEEDKTSLRMRFHKKADDWMHARAVELRDQMDSVLVPIAHALVDVYRSYQASKSSDTQPPPKRLKKDVLTPVKLTQIIYTSAAIHSHQPRSMHYEVTPPYGYDSEGEDENDSEMEMPQMRQMILMQRSICMRVCCAKDAQARDKAREIMQETTPASLSWKDVMEIPNSCPICSRILFRRDGYGYERDM